MPDRSYVVRLLLDIQQYKAAGKEFTATNDGMGKSVAKTTKNTRDLERGLLVTGAVFAGAFLLAANSARKFDAAMANVNAVTDTSGQTAEQAAHGFDQLSKAAIKAGQATIYNAEQAAQAEAELEKAGISTGDILGGALTGSLALASAGSLELADAATTAARAMNLFDLSGAEVGHVADVLAAGANKSAADVHQLSAALRQSGLIAHNIGLSFEDTVGVLAAFADNALYGSDAGTSFKAALQQLQAPSMKSAALMKELGINLYDAQGSFIGITAFAGQLQKSLGGLTQAERDYAFAQIFGTDATRAATVLYKEGASGIAKYIAEVDDQGAAADTAAKKLDNLNGDIERLSGAFETLTISAGSGPNKALRGLTQLATDLVNSFALLPQSIQSTLVVLSALGAVAFLAFGVFLKLQRKLREVNEELLLMGPAAAKAGGVLLRTTKIIAGVSLALGALQVYSSAFGSDFQQSAKRSNEQLERFLKNADDSGSLVKHLSYDLGTLDPSTLAKIGNGIAGTVESLTGLGKVADESLQHAQERLQALDQALADMVGAGNVQEARQLFAKIGEEAAKHGVDYQRLQDSFTQYVAALDSYEQKAADTAAANAKLGHSQLSLNTSIEESIEKGKSLVDIFNELNGAALSLAEAEINVEDALDNVTDSLKENGKTLDIHDDKGRKNLTTILDTIKASRDAAQAKYEETGSLEKATAEYDQHIAALKKELLQAGFTKKQVDDLINTYAQLPPLKTTQIKAVGIETTLAELARVSKAIHDMTLGIINVDLSRFASGNKGEDYRHERYGGVITHAAMGSFRDASIYQPAARGAVYGIAEPGTGGEAFIPKHGDYWRGMAILDQAAKWYGARVQPAGGAGSMAGGGSSVTYQIYPQTAQFGINELDAYTRQQDARQRVGRSR